MKVRSTLIAYGVAAARIFATARPCYTLHRKGDEWGVAVLHAGREIAWLSPAEARRDAATLVNLANLACYPGGVPGELG